METGSKPVECTIEQLLGRSAAELEAFTQEELLEVLKPILLAQEAIFEKLKGAKTVAQRSVAPAGAASRMQAVSQQRTRLPSMESKIKSGMTAQQAVIANLTESGIRITPEMLEMLKSAKSKPQP